jgi:hypothetical protein
MGSLVVATVRDDAIDSTIVGHRFPYGAGGGKRRGEPDTTLPNEVMRHRSRFGLLSSLGRVGHAPGTASPFRVGVFQDAAATDLDVVSECDRALELRR